MELGRIGADHDGADNIQYPSICGYSDNGIVCDDVCEHAHKTRSLFLTAESLKPKLSTSLPVLS